MEEKPKVKCAYPLCSFMAEGQLTLCLEHKQMLDFLLWALSHIRFQQQPNPSRLIVPQKTILAKIPS